MDADLGLLVLRVAVGGVVMAHGLMKFGWWGMGGSIGGLAGWFDGLGLRPGLFWAWVSALAETFGGLLMVVGLGGSLGPGILVGDLLVVTVVAHWAQGFWASQKGIGIEFPVPLAAAAFAVALTGPGRWSVDAALALGYPEWFAPAWVIVSLFGGGLALLSRTFFAPRSR